MDIEQLGGFGIGFSLRQTRFRGNQSTCLVLKLCVYLPILQCRQVERGYHQHTRLGARSCDVPFRYGSLATRTAPHRLYLRRRGRMMHQSGISPIPRYSSELEGKKIDTRAVA